MGFNRQAGFTEEDDELLDFFYDEPLAPTGKSARHHTADCEPRGAEAAGGGAGLGKIAIARSSRCSVDEFPAAPVSGCVAM